MYVRKFEAETVEAALKQIKQELGPDAVILKTITNKGLKGAFKKSRIEITAAVSEKNYIKKSHVDSVLHDKKEEFYNSSSSYVSNMIDTYAENNNKVNTHPASSYGKIALNKTVKTSSAQNISPNNSLDSFLAVQNQEIVQVVETKNEIVPEITKAQQQEFLGKSSPPSQKSYQPTDATNSQSDVVEGNHLLKEFDEKFNYLEKKIFEINKKIEKIEEKGPVGLVNLKTLLKTFDINHNYIQRLIKEIITDLSFEHLQDADLVFEMALKKMASQAKTKIPLIVNDCEADGPSITILLSEVSVGQSTMMLKIGSLVKNVSLIQHQHHLYNENIERSNFTEKIFDLNLKRTTSIPEIITNCREGITSGKHVIVDFRNNNRDVDEIKKFIDGIKRTFLKVEVFICISAIHGELYNKKVINTFYPFTDGIVVSHLDLCLNYGTLFNLFTTEHSLPFVYYGTGRRVPDDIEAATVERLLSGVFQLV